MSEQINQKMLKALKALQMEAAARGCGLKIADDVLAEAEQQPHVFEQEEFPDIAQRVCKYCIYTERSIIHIKPAPLESPTREELIDALRRAEQLLSRPSRPYVEEMRDRVIFNEVLSRCNPTADSAHATWTVDLKTGSWERNPPEPIKITAKPQECKGNGSAMLSAGYHCPCVERCCFCGWEQVKHEPKGRRWEVEFANGLRPTTNTIMEVSRVICEVKPITREQVFKIWNDPKAQPDLIGFLRELGIQVED